MTQEHQEITIQAPPAKVFAVLTDFDAGKDWLGGVTESRKLTPGPVRVGTEAAQRKRLMNKPRAVAVKVASLAEGRSLWLDVQPERLVAARVGFELAPVAGGTQVKHTTQFELRGLQRLMGPMVAGTVRKSMAHDLAALKRKVEGA